MDRIIEFSYSNTAIGEMMVGTMDEKCLILDFVNRRSLERLIQRKSVLLGAEMIERKTKFHMRIIDQVNQYLGGERSELNFPIMLVGTDFQKQVWQELLHIPYGETTSYGKLAASLTSSPRAVGLANGSNTLALVVPCHRVIGSDGSLVGYGGGTDRKRKLLEMEKKYSDKQSLENWFTNK